MRLWPTPALAVGVTLLAGGTFALGAPKDDGNSDRSNPQSQVQKTSTSTPGTVPESTETKAPTIDPKKREQLLQQLRDLYPKDGFGI
ncbi:MAG TPA: hypothetical protein VI895_08330 [Bdellovibrionota bacterium]|nr:hypothetical protein [Bdellovibrionota bacterium]